MKRQLATPLVKYKVLYTMKTYPSTAYPLSYWTNASYKYTRLFYDSLAPDVLQCIATDLLQEGETIDKLLSNQSIFISKNEIKEIRDVINSNKQNEGSTIMEILQRERENEEPTETITTTINTTEPSTKVTIEHPNGNITPPKIDESYKISNEKLIYFIA